ncbi:MAG: murein biosynthesis integral membrane protein MurJ [bacterium]
MKTGIGHSFAAASFLLSGRNKRQACERSVEILAQGRITRAAGIIVAASIISKLLGVVRERVIAVNFGAGMVTDAYLVALTIPNIIILLATEAVTAGYLPVFASLLARRREKEAGRVAGSLTAITAVLLAGLSLTGIILAPALVRLVAPNFTPDAAAAAVYLSRIIFPVIFFMSLGAVFTVTLQSLQHFTVPALAPLAMNAAIIAVVALGGSRYGGVSLAFGTLLGMGLQAAIQLPQLLRLMRQRGIPFALKAADPQVREVGRLSLPVVGRTLVMQAYTLVERMLASGLAAGSIASLNFANKLMQLPYGVFATAVTTAIFPTLSEQAARDAKEEMAGTLLHGVRTVALIILPAMVGLIVLRVPIVRLVFEQGAFDAAATQATAAALLYYSLGLAGHAGNLVLTRAFFALHDTMTPLKLSFATTGMTAVAAVILVRPLQHGGLALANSLGVLTATGLLYYNLKRLLPQLDSRGLLYSLGKIGLASLLMGGAVSGLALTPPVARLLAAGPLAGTVLLIAAGGFTYFLALLLLRVEELAWLLALLRQRRPGRRGA